MARPRLALLAVLALAGVPARAHAGGFELPGLGARALGRGGAFTVGASDTTAMIHNPAALARLRGTRFSYQQPVVFSQLEYQRAPLSDAWGTDGGTTFPAVHEDARVYAKNLVAILASDFGLRRFTFAAGVFGPHAVGERSFPAYGPQSFMMTDMKVMLAHYAVTAAFQIPDRFAIGVTLAWVDLIRLDYGLVADATAVSELSPVPDPDGTQLRTELRLRDRTGFTALAGVWYRPLPRLELALAGRVVPARLHARGEVWTDKPTLVTDDLRARMDLTLPVQIRGGVRFVQHRHGRERFDVELDVGWENWRAVDRFAIGFDGAIAGRTLADVAVPKRWRDTAYVGLGSDVRLLDGALVLRGGGFFESAAVPRSTTHLDFPSFARGGPSVGLGTSFRGIHLNVGYAHVFQEQRSVSETEADVLQLRPLSPCPEGCDGLRGVPANAGSFRSAFDLLALGLEIDFETLIRGRSARR